METSALITMLIAGIIGYFFWDLRQTKSKQLEQERKIAKLEARETVTEERVRKISQEEYSSIKEDINELKTSMKDFAEIFAQIRIDLGILKYHTEKEDKENKGL